MWLHFFFKFNLIAFNVYVCYITALRCNFVGWHDGFSLSFLHVFFLLRVRKKCRSPGIKIGEIQTEDRRLNVHDKSRCQKVSNHWLTNRWHNITYYISWFMLRFYFYATSDSFLFYYKITSKYSKCHCHFSKHRW